MTILSDPTFWTGVGLVMFLLILVWQNVPAAIAKSLDARADAIRNELDEAKRLRTEAEALLAQYEKKRGEAEKEAEAILAAARAEAERMTHEAKGQLQAQIERRAKMAEQKIAQAETKALADVRAAAADAAVQAAEKILRAQMQEGRADAIVDAGLKDLRSKLH